MAKLTTLPFSQINVFSSNPLGGNPVAVVHSADDLIDEEMAALARWTNLSETTFLLRPDHDDADYKLRIFTPGGELPFAGHPTLGSCFAWLDAGGKAKNIELVVQQCKAGLISIRNKKSILEFAAPPLIRTGNLDESTLQKIMKGLSLTPGEVLHHQWVDNGPGWCAVLLKSARDVLELESNWSQLSPLNLGVVAPHEDGHESQIEVRAFVGGGGYEDPVTGSLNASIAQWLIKSGFISTPYVSSQGTVLKRTGRINVNQAEGQIWIGGETIEVIKGEISVQATAS